MRHFAYTWRLGCFAHAQVPRYGHPKRASITSGDPQFKNINLHA